MTDGVVASDALGAELRSLVAGRCRSGWRTIDPRHIAMLTDVEAALVERAVEQRRAEFATGRVLLRNLLGADVEILRSENGAPRLPAEFVGSLAHDGAIALAVIATRSSVRAVGVDVEGIQQLDDRVAELIVRPDDVVPDPLTAFVAKEAAYKAWSALGGDILEHRDVNVIVDGDRYRADLRGELVVRGELGRAAGRRIALVLIPAT